MMKHTFSFARLCLLGILCLCMLLTCACGKDAPPSDAPEGCLLAWNEAVDYSFYYPDTWELDRNDGMIAVKYNVGEKGALAYASISVQAFDLEKANIGANEYWEDYRADLTDVYGEKVAFLSEKEETRLGGVIANRNSYTIKLSDMTYRFEQVFCIRNGVVYLVTLTAPEVKKDAVQEAFETVLSGFAFR